MLNFHIIMLNPQPQPPSIGFQRALPAVQAATYKTPGVYVQEVPSG